MRDDMTPQSHRQSPTSGMDALQAKGAACGTQ